MVLTSVQLSEKDYKFCKDNGLKFSDLLRQAIFQQQQLAGGLIVDNVLEERRKRESWQAQADKLRDFLTNKGLMDEFLKEAGM